MEVELTMMRVDSAFDLMDIFKGVVFAAIARRCGAANLRAGTERFSLSHPYKDHEHSRCSRSCKRGNHRCFEFE
jgi:hypothetical protein